MTAKQIKRRRLLLAYLLGFLAIMLLIGPCRFNHISVCSVCGRIRHTSRRTFPLVAIPYWSSHSEESTPFSDVCLATGLVGDHEHQWQFVAGGQSVFGRPFGLSGSGRGSIIIVVAKSEQAANFIKCLVAFDSRKKAENWKETLLDPNTSHIAYSAVWNIGKFPESGFDNANDYETWLAANEAEMIEILPDARKGTWD